MSDNQKHIVPYELLTRYLSGDISEGDRATAEKWIHQSSDNERAFKELKSVWDQSDRVRDLTSINLEAEWEKQKESVNSDKSFSSPSQYKRPFWNIAKIAAVFIVLFTAAFAIYYYGPFFNISRLITSDEIDTLLLADGTKITLNANSSIRYPIEFKGNSRQVMLKGEAYFEVSPDRDKPFIVETEETLIRVVGTAFNVKAYEGGVKTDVIVTEGRVAFLPKKTLQDTLYLEKAMRGSYDRISRSLSIHPNEDMNFLAWKTRRIRFDNHTLQEVVEILEQVYQTEINIKEPDLMNCKITATFDRQSLEAVLNVIASTLDLTINKEGPAYSISGDACL